MKISIFIVSLISILLLTILISSAQDKLFLSYKLKISDNKGEYLINVKEYNYKSYFRREDWESPNIGSVSYITIKDCESSTNYLLLHKLKKAFLITSSPNEGIFEEAWISDIHLALLKKEEMVDEKIEGYKCKRTKFTGNNPEEICTVWFSPELNRYLKVESTISDFPLELYITGIKKIKGDMKIFEVPKGYEMVKTQK